MGRNAFWASARKVSAADKGVGRATSLAYLSDIGLKPTLLFRRSGRGARPEVTQTNLIYFEVAFEMGQRFQCIHIHP